MAIDQKAYEEALEAAQMSVEPVTIEGVTADNWHDKLAEYGINEMKDVNGNTSGYYVNTLMSVVEPGQFSTSKKVQVFVTPHYDNTSTSSNTKVTFEYLPAGSTDTSAGGQTVYIDKDDYFKNTMKAAGYDVGDIPPEVLIEMWENYYQQDDTVGNLVKTGIGSLIDSKTGIPIGSSAIEWLDVDRSDIMYSLMKVADFGSEKMASCICKMRATWSSVVFLPK